MQKMIWRREGTTIDKPDTVKAVAPDGRVRRGCHKYGTAEADALTRTCVRLALST